MLLAPEFSRHSRSGARVCAVTCGLEKEGDGIQPADGCIHCVERHGAPVVSFNTYVNARIGGRSERPDRIAPHMEHMAFRVTPQSAPRAGWARSRLCCDRTASTSSSRRSAGGESRKKKLEALEEAVQKAIAKADDYVQPERIRIASSSETAESA